jgi:hypothetical protein
MALIRDFTLDGVNYPQAYSRIDATRVTSTEAGIGVLTYASFDDRASGTSPIWTDLFLTTYDIVAHDVFPASYAFLKTLPEFAGAIDHNNPPEAPAPELN